MKTKKKQRFQKKLNHHESEHGLSEYAMEHLVTPTYGPLKTDDMYAELDSLEFFTENKLSKFRNRLKKSMAKYPNYFLKIEAGLASYASSATKKTKELAILVQSLLSAFENILMENYENTPEIEKQFIPKNYFESFGWLEEFNLKEIDLIQSDALKLYTKRANELTIAAMKEWFFYTLKKNGDMALATNYEQISVNKGVNRAGYYHELQLKPDVLSAYTGIDDAAFFESDLLSSYTLSHHVANKFVSGTINQKGQRRLKVEGHPEMIEDRILSSWIVSPSFLDGQYEILCLPNIYTLRTAGFYSTDLLAGFNLKKN